MAELTINIPDNIKNRVYTALSNGANGNKEALAKQVVIQFIIDAVELYEVKEAATPVHESTKNKVKDEILLT